MGWLGLIGHGLVLGFWVTGDVTGIPLVVALTAWVITGLLPVAFDEFLVALGGAPLVIAGVGVLACGS